MSVLPQQIPYDQYVADGITTTYIYNFLVLQAISTPASDIAVYVTLAGATPTPASDIQPLNIAYTVTNVGNLTGGTIIFQPGYIPPASAIITIVRNMNFSITTNFSVAQNFNGANLDSAFQRVVLQMQQLYADFVYTALQYPINAFLPSRSSNILPILTTHDNQVWMSQGGQIIAALIEENPDFSTLRSQLASQAPGGGAGASLIGYYDSLRAQGTTVNAELNKLVSIYGTYVDTGIVNAMAVTIPNFVTLYAGDTINVIPKFTNTSTAPTISINGGLPIGIVNNNEQLLLMNDYLAQVSSLEQNITVLRYNGTHFQLMNPFVYKVSSVSIVQILANNQTIAPTGTPALVVFDDVIADGYMRYTLATSSYTATTPGTYQFSINVAMSTNSTIPGTIQLYLYKNGVQYRLIDFFSFAGAIAAQGLKATFSINANLNDYFQVYAAVNSANGTTTIQKNNGIIISTFEMNYLGA